MKAETIVGQGTHTYAVDPSWGRREGGVKNLGMAQGVTGDSQGRVYVFQRTPVACMHVFDPDGKLLDTWGEGVFREPHGIWMTPEDELLLTDLTLQTVTRWTTDGRLLRTWGTEGTAGEWGQPFNRPTKAIETADGELYVSDGYGNRHVHRFDTAGELVQSWGADGDGPGEFVLPHDVWVDEQERVLVCDRENYRVQHFDREGAYLGEWSRWQRPMQIFVREGVMYVTHAGAEVSIRTPDGELLTSWPYESVLVHEQERSPHSVWVDSRGDIYVGEVTGEGGLQKYTRQ